MIWATVSSWSYFCWLYRAFPSLAAKNIISLISVLTIWWGQCVESSLMLLEESVCYDQGVLLAKLLLAFALLHSVLQGQICLLLQVFLDFLLLHSSPLQCKGHLFWMLVLKGLVSLHRTVQLQLLQHYWSGHRLLVHSGSFFLVSSHGGRDKGAPWGVPIPFMWAPPWWSDPIPRAPVYWSCHFLGLRVSM